MQRDPVLTALNDCSAAVLRGTNGHHTRWAVKRCTNALVLQGTAPALAEACARAAAAVAQAVAAKHLQAMQALAAENAS